ncbi:ribulose-phosphate 3-epimerase [Mediterraneibacter sp. NSJ-55]|uniref:Ribulose-phosphate 3-epimerase n=1 Tax=Mediterraneibacter hominis TaxID=2763054 RepID=A0A923LKC8_9FIRM|nr:D-allulose 6-phosphate 3-epimerase [Mediterraneibacter hominis]MBC5690457.1 ribulose-phosphate 3-epimerase [Mediterraneibacter hominis]
MKKVLFAPSLMCMDMMNLSRDLTILDEYMDLYHIDIMDGHFCPNIALSPTFCNMVRKNVRLPMDVHLMCEEPRMSIEALELGKNDYISVQAETVEKNVFRIYELIHKKGNKFGVVLSPAVPLTAIENYKKRIDLLTIMTIDTGFAGQKFIPEMLEKVKNAIRIREESNCHYLIQIDGACNKNTFKQLYEAGADILVVGNSGLFSLDKDLGTAAKKMKEQFEILTGVKNEHRNNFRN